MKLSDSTICATSLNLTYQSKLFFVFVLSYLDKYGTIPKPEEIGSCLNLSPEDMKVCAEELKRDSLVEKIDGKVTINFKSLLKAAEKCGVELVSEIVSQENSVPSDEGINKYFASRNKALSKINTSAKLKALFDSKYSESSFTLPLLSVSHLSDFRIIYPKIVAINDKDKERLVELYIAKCKEDGIKCDSKNLLKCLGSLLPKLKNKGVCASGGKRQVAGKRSFSVG